MQVSTLAAEQELEMRNGLRIERMEAGLDVRIEIPLALDRHAKGESQPRQAVGRPNRPD
jgi:hypothetical protein